jgi:hypothetical protein
VQEVLKVYVALLVRKEFKVQLVHKVLEELKVR